MNVIHAFEEVKLTSQRAHLRMFFGMIPSDDDKYDEETGSYVVCYCGARLVPIDRNSDGDIINAAVWHNRIVPRSERDE